MEGRWRVAIRSVAVLGMSLLLVSTTPRGGGATVRTGSVSLELDGATAAEAASALAAAIGVPVEARGGAGRQLHLRGTFASARAALDRVAFLLAGRWRPVLEVREPEAAPPSPSPPLEGFVTLGLRDASAAQAFGLVAQELKAELRLRGRFEQRISLVLVNVPTDQALDRIAQQARANWRLHYVLDAPDLPPPPPPRREEPAAQKEPTPGIPPAAPPPAPAAPPVPSGPELRNALRSAVDRVIRAGPDRRAGAVEEFVRSTSQLFASLETLGPAERVERLRFLVPLLASWRRLYSGTTPAVARELAPVNELLEKHLGRP